MKAIYQSQPLITVNDVELSSKRYQKILGRKSGHGGDEYEQLVVGDRMIFQLHAWDLEHDHHPYMGKKSIQSRATQLIISNGQVPCLL